jgi:hypothetical protein
MLIFWRQRLVLLATPKTASTAIEQALEPLAALVVQRPPVLKHTDARRYQQFVGPYLTASCGHGFTVCALMREPRDWLGSWYRTRQRDDVPDEQTTRGVSFDAFVQAHCSNPPPEFANVGSQADFLAPDGQRVVGHIFRYEEIDRFVAFLEDRLDCEITLPRVNVSPDGDQRLSMQTAAVLQQFRARDFELYGAIESR